MKKTCIVCHGGTEYNYGGYVVPCPHCEGTGETEVVVRPAPTKGYLFIAPNQVYIMAPEPWLVNTAKMNEAILLAKNLPFFLATLDSERPQG